MLTALVVLLATVQGPDKLVADDPPTDADVLRAMPRVARGLRYLFEEYRDDVVIVKNRIVDQVVFIPLPTGASVTLAVAQWECRVNYTQTTKSRFPFNAKTTEVQVASVIYLDRARVVK